PPKVLSRRALAARSPFFSRWRVLFTTPPVVKIQHPKLRRSFNLFAALRLVCPFLVYERTIRNAAECSGVGLHSGAPVHLRILPAPAGTGIVFRRVDLDGFEVEAICRNVAKVSYATSLMKKGVLISTTEHLLSAFIGMGIDNAIVELDNLELPILDGSARPFVEMIQQAGIRQQRKARSYLRIVREIELREGDKFITVYPDDAYSVSYSINFPHPLIGKETFQV